MSVMIATSLGDIVVDLHTDRCPLTTKNFLKLCKIKYFNGVLFHTVQKDFTAQTGDPTGTGTGGDSIFKYLYGEQARFFGDEIHQDLKHYKTGTVAMASAGENLNASQFYFTLRDDLDYLDGKHTVFGEVAEGLDTLTRINETYVDDKGRPYKNIRIKHTYILDDPFDDPPQLTEFIPDASPEGKPQAEVDDEVRLEDDWVPMDEQLGASELEEVIRAKEAHSRAVVLESIGDIPDAEMKPPENVLFVCKLNPVTEDDDLNTIFSRFGNVVSAEVIRDFKTGDSLCYAFIEFENIEACEQAYFKMDNALIDDRRIHVDFSQSVAKLWSQYRRKEHQTGKGRGCFKCGALDHIAKDCTGSPTTKSQSQKYVLKDGNFQRGGNDKSTYEMVFDGDTPATSERDKRPREQDSENEVKKRRMDKQNEEDRKHRDHEKRGDRSRHEDRIRGSREDERNRGYRPSGSRREENERDHKNSGSDGGRRRSDRDQRNYENDERRRGGRHSHSRNDDSEGGRSERDHGRIDGDKVKRSERDYKNDTEGDRGERHYRRNDSDRGNRSERDYKNDREVGRRSDRR